MGDVGVGVRVELSELVAVLLCVPLAGCDGVSLALADELEEGLSELGFSCEDAE